MKASGGVAYAVVAVVVLLSSGCSSGGGATISPSAHSQVSSGTSGDSAGPAIIIKDFGFQGPASVAAGATVTVTNMDSQAHTVTADDGSSFDVLIKGSGGTATFTAPTQPGSYAYHCTFHANMHGTLVVK
jgi:plastocyanin